MYRECEYCGKQVHLYHKDGYRTTRSSMKYCNDECRDLYWSEMRKVRRAVDRATEAINLLIYYQRHDNKTTSREAQDGLLLLQYKIKDAFKGMSERQSIRGDDTTPTSTF